MKICVLRLGAMGDILFTTPALRALRRQYPEAHITYILLKQWAGLLRGNPNVDRIVGLPYREPKALGRLRKECFDLVINFHELEDGARLCQALRARQRLGHQWKNGALCPDENSRLLIKDTATLLSLYRSRTTYPQLFCRIAQVEFDPGRYEYYPGGSAVWKARLFLGLRGFWRGKAPIALHLHSRGMPAKNWPVESACSVVRALPDERFILLAYRPDREATRVLEAEPNVTVHLGRFPEQAEVIRRCALFVGIDSGPRHIASAMGTRALGLFGARPSENVGEFPGDRSLTVDWPCAPCYEDTCPKGCACLSQIPSERIVAEIRNILLEVRSGTVPQVRDSQAGC
ncbi:MAG TPA: glycosyltransferase family 9 protein [Candidatus Sumerlaeota bacterium]|nr:glycosyltransferase family 9 protein [Candidatus Sumerlaeota bacterium]